MNSSGSSSPSKNRFDLAISRVLKDTGDMISIEDKDKVLRKFGRSISGYLASKI